MFKFSDKHGDVGCSAGTLRGYLDIVDELGFVDYVRRGKYEYNNVDSVTEEGEKALDFVQEVVEAVDEELEEQGEEEELKVWEKNQ